MADGMNSVDQDRRRLVSPAEQCIRAAFEAIGITRFQLPHEIGALFSITAKQARRKLKDDIWSLDELLALQRRCGASLLGVLQDDLHEVDAGAHRVPALLVINGESLACEVQVGKALKGLQSSGLVCIWSKGRLVVSTSNFLTESGARGERFAINGIWLRVGSAPLRVAVLDDDILASQSLAEWFSENGYPAQSFTTIQQLEAAGLDAFDVFIVDVVLGGGQTCGELVVRIREADPWAIVVLLTGKLRTKDMEAEIAEIVRDQRVEFHAKPTSPLVLLSTVLNSVARRRQGPLLN